MNEEDKHASVLLAVANTGYEHLGGAHGVDQWRKVAKGGEGGTFELHIMLLLGLLLLLLLLLQLR